MNTAILIILLLTIVILYVRLNKAKDEALEFEIQKNREEQASEINKATKNVAEAEKLAKEKVLNYETKKTEFVDRLKRFSSKPKNNS